MGSSRPPKLFQYLPYMNAIGYKRLSQNDQSSYSLDAQDKGIRDYCLRYNLNLVSVFTDNGESSYDFDRPDFIALEDYLKKQKSVQYLIVYHNDRFSRNLAEALLKIKDLERKFKIHIRSISDPLDIDFSDPANFMKRAFEFMLAENELHRIRERTRSGLRQAALSGRLINKAPFGYQNARDEHNKPILIIHEEKAVLVRLIYREFLRGMALYELHRLARRHGFNQNGNSAVLRILQNPVYAGMIKVPATRKEPGKLVKGLHTPIISEQDYWLVQQKIPGRSVATQNREEVPLRGVLKTRTGRLFTAMNARSKSGRYYWYYQEQDSKKIYSANKLHHQFYSLLDELTFDAQTLQWFKEDVTGQLEKYLSERGARLKDLQDQLRMIDRRIESVETKYLTKPDISETSFNRVMNELRADRSRVQKDLANSNTSQHVYWDYLRELFLKLSDLRTSFNDLPLTKKHQFINMVFCNELSYSGDTYKTPGLHPFFKANELTLKQKGLLIIAAPVIKMGDTPVCSGDGSHTKTIAHELQQFIEIFGKAG